MNIFHFFSALLTPSIRGVLSICEGDSRMSQSFHYVAKKHEYAS